MGVWNVRPARDPNAEYSWTGHRHRRGQASDLGNWRWKSRTNRLALPRLLLPAAPQPPQTRLQELWRRSPAYKGAHQFRPIEGAARTTHCRSGSQGQGPSANLECKPADPSCQAQASQSKPCCAKAYRTHAAACQGPGANTVSGRWFQWIWGPNPCCPSRCPLSQRRAEQLPNSKAESTEPSTTNTITSITTTAADSQQQPAADAAQDGTQDAKEVPIPLVPLFVKQGLPRPTNTKSI